MVLSQLRTRLGGTCRQIWGTEMKGLVFAALLAGAALSGTAVAQDARQIALGGNVSLGGMRLLPDDSPWHRDVSQDAVDPKSAKILARFGLNTPLHPDFGAVWEGVPLGL